ncbi:cyclic peptide export ABC transporter [Bacillus cereus]|nr:cyclic peptide export ABC transporter [Bacillus cereus]
MKKIVATIFIFLLPMNNIYAANNNSAADQNAYILKYASTMNEYAKMLSPLISLLIIVLLVLTGKVVAETLSKKRTLTKSKKDIKWASGILISVIVLFGVCLYISPNYIMKQMTWYDIYSLKYYWIITFAILTFVCLIFYLVYINILFTCTRMKEKNFIAIISLSILNGLMNTLIILTINETFNTNLMYSMELLMFFLFFLVFLVYTQKLLQEKLIKTTNQIINEKRIAIVNEIMNSSYENIENIGSSKIYTVLNNDTEAISRLPEIFVVGCSSLLTIIFCMSYLGYQNIYGFIGSLVIIILNLIFNILINRKASKYWRKNREMKDKYFGYITDMLQGFKELNLNRVKRGEYSVEMNNCTKETTDYNVVASTKILNFTLYNTTIYNIIFAVVVFIFPMLLTQINVNDLRETLFIVFYLIGPFQSVTNCLTQYEAMKVNMKQIDNLTTMLKTNSNQQQPVNFNIESYENFPTHIELKLNNIEYSYYSTDAQEISHEFKLGPVNLEFHTGEIIFIVGGNGSGKSTLSKIITGLYKPHKGQITVNGRSIHYDELNNYFSAIFNDFHLFRKMYGVDLTKSEQSIQSLLALMKLDDKVVINEEREINSEELSTGQKKRLAYIISCLENKPLILLDEWAAEQDPEFKAFFYEELLKGLKSQGKCIIVVTHDDQYFHVADRIIKLDSGKIFQNQVTLDVDQMHELQRSSL